ncbi:anti-sigma factor [Aquabacterium sp. OR-4]|uniref:anti-sigma factor n=1 Tax=Aquabacterium sp. OR-4 TaxID=2978127 RepID=UPI0021B36A55|nr:anti-sigma factor [Aquabacterium sp. OR-4]MDT7835588.1 anti-sigma factor [Aquabacterium sp. OR-4]
MDYGRRDLADALAAQYVAGSLRGAARRRFEALMPGHPALRTAVAAWQQRLMPLTGVIAPVPVPPEVWRRIEQRLWPRAAPQAWWQRLGWWRAATGVAAVASLSLAVLLQQQPGAGDAPPVVVVLQATEAGAPSTTLVASVSGDGQSMVMRPLQPVALAADRALELWAVPPQGAPRSLGLISAAGVTVLRRDRLPASLLDAGKTAALAVSVEPPGGSPTGAPSGPVVYAGKLQL